MKTKVYYRFLPDLKTYFDWPFSIIAQKDDWVFIEGKNYKVIKCQFLAETNCIFIDLFKPDFQEPL